MEWTGFKLVPRSAVQGRWVHWLVCMATRRLLSWNQLSNKFLISESLLFSGDAKTDLYTSSSHNLISKPIKLTSFPLKPAVESIGNPRFMSRPRKIENFQHKTYFNLSANQLLQPFSGWKHVYDIYKKKSLAINLFSWPTYFKAILSTLQPLCILCLSYNSDNFILYFSSHDVNLCLPPDFRGSSDQPQPGFFPEARERTLGTRLTSQSHHTWQSWTTSGFVQRRVRVRVCRDGRGLGSKLVLFAIRFSKHPHISAIFKVDYE